MTKETENFTYQIWYSYTCANFGLALSGEVKTHLICDKTNRDCIKVRRKTILSFLDTNANLQPFGPNAS